MKNPVRVTLVAATSATLIATSVLCGFVWGAYVQYRHIVFADQAELARALLAERICAEHGCDALREWLAGELPFLMNGYSLEYAAIHEPLPLRLAGITRTAWVMRNSVNDAMMKPPLEYQRRIDGAVERLKSGNHIANTPKTEFGGNASSRASPP